MDKSINHMNKVIALEKILTFITFFSFKKLSTSNPNSLSFSDLSSLNSSKLLKFS